jgi:hypothetical protein
MMRLGSSGALACVKKDVDKENEFRRNLGMHENEQESKEEVP